MGSTKLRLLLEACPPVPLSSGPRAVARVREGRLPWGLTHWPDQVQRGLGRGVQLQPVPLANPDGLNWLRDAGLLCEPTSRSPAHLVV